MPIMYFFKCDVCGTQSDANASAGTPAGWMTLNISPAEGASEPVRYFDKAQCLATFAAQQENPAAQPQPQGPPA